jgi:hypothetical protein
MAAIGRKGGQIGGKRRLKTMTKAERSKVPEMLAGAALPVNLGASGSGAGIWPVETATVHAASWSGSPRTFALADGHRYLPRCCAWCMWCIRAQLR